MGAGKIVGMYLTACEAKEASALAERMAMGLGTLTRRLVQRALVQARGSSGKTLKLDGIEMWTERGGRGSRKHLPWCKGDCR